MAPDNRPGYYWHNATPAEIDAPRPARTVGPLRLRGDKHAVTCKWPHRYGCSCGLDYPSNRGKES